MSGMLTGSELATLATAYSEATGVSLAALGSTLFNDHRFFKRLVAGQDCTTQNARRASEYLIAHWPQNTPWPNSLRGRIARESAA